jgi:hypothetical protein
VEGVFEINWFHGSALPASHIPLAELAMNVSSGGFRAVAGSSRSGPIERVFLFKNEVQLGGTDVAGNGRVPVG